MVFDDFPSEAYAVQAPELITRALSHRMGTRYLHYGSRSQRYDTCPIDVPKSHARRYAAWYSLRGAIPTIEIKRGDA
jgi:hypothetical protein